MPDSTFVLCVAACSGGGKTSVVNELVNRLQNSKAIYFDEYKMDFLRQDYYNWSISGNDYNEWDLKPITDDIEEALKESFDYLILDYPMGYANSLVAKYIDFAVFLDVPLDILLARRILRDYLHRDSNRRPIHKPFEHMSNMLSDYIDRYRATYINHMKEVVPRCDVIIDGYKPIPEIVSDIVGIIKNK